MLINTTAMRLPRHMRSEMDVRHHARDQSANVSINIVEDDLKTSNALAVVLEENGYNPIQVFDYVDLRVDSHADAPFMILDVSLQTSDAVDVIRTLAEWRYRGVVQLVSGKSLELLEDIRRLGENCGLTMLPVMRKPVYPASLIAIIDRELAAAPLSAGVGLEHAVDAIATDPSVDLQEALREGWVEVWYQPKYDVATHVMVGAECLSRVRHPDRGIVLPGNFLQGACREVVASLTDRVLRQACLDWRDFDKIGRQLQLAVNVPGSQLVDLPLVAMIRELAPRCEHWSGIILEITENEALHDIEAARAICTQLQIYGVSLSIDDFGMGHSSFSRLREIPFKEIKLDRSLVDGCADDEVKGALCRSVIDLAHSFDAKAVAEGVERKKDLDYLRAIWCDLAQGYFCARPMPKDQLVSLMAAFPSPG